MPHGVSAEFEKKPAIKRKTGFTDGGCIVGAPYRWKPGQSGNPSGRPKKKPITEIFEKILEDGGNIEDISKAVMETLKTKGMAKVLLLDKMADRVEGKVKDELDVNVTLGLADQIATFRQKRLKSTSEE